MSDLRDAIRDVLKEHGTALLLPEDEFDCCADAVADLFEQVAWFQPNRELGQRFWDAKWTPNEQWSKPVVAVFRLRQHTNSTSERNYSMSREEAIRRATEAIENAEKHATDSPRAGVHLAAADLWVRLATIA